MSQPIGWIADLGAWTVAQIQGHLIAHQYEGLIKKSKLRGGKRGR